MKREFLSTSIVKLMMSITLIVGIGAVMGLMGYYSSIPEVKTVVDNKAQIEEISIERLVQSSKINWDNYPPEKFNLETSLEKIRKDVYAFPGYKYDKLAVKNFDKYQFIVDSKNE